jgi:Ni,Fe-hydrogenase maturation factor
MKFVFAILFLCVAVQLSESFFFNKVTQRPTQRPFSHRPWAVSGDQVAEAVVLENLREFVQNNLITPFIEKILKPLENNLLRPLEQNIKQKLSEFQWTTLPKVKQFFKDSVLDPIEQNLQVLKEQINVQIERFGKFISKESRDQYKKKIAELIDTKLRQPLLERVQKLLKRIENELEESPEAYEAQPVFFDTIKDFVERNFITPFVNNILKPIEERFIRPLERNIREQLSVLKLDTIPKAKEFIQSKILEPVESALSGLQNKIHEYIETFGKLISKESREQYKRQITEFIDNRIRTPLLERIQIITDKIAKELNN